MLYLNYLAIFLGYIVILIGLFFLLVGLLFVWAEFCYTRRWDKHKKEYQQYLKLKEKFGD